MNTRPNGRVLKHLPRDQVSVNAMKRTCVIVIFTYLPYSSQIHAENAVKTIKYPFLTLDFSKQNGVGCKLSNVITLSQRYNRAQRFREQKHQKKDQSGPQRFLYNVM